MATKKPNTFGTVRTAMREHALATVKLPATGRALVSFEGMPWLGVLEVTEGKDGTRDGVWRNVTVVRPY